MGIPKKIRLNNGSNGKAFYYYWDEYDTFEEAREYARELKMNRKKDFKLRYFILETQDSWFLPVPKFVVYLDRKLRLI